MAVLSRPHQLKPKTGPRTSHLPFPTTRIAGDRCLQDAADKMTRKPRRKLPASPSRRDSPLEPYHGHAPPSAAQCLAVRDALLAFHGFPDEFAPFRLLRLGLSPEDEGDQPAPRPTVLDGLVTTLLSQNTTDAISRRAFASLKAAFPSWDQVR